MFQFPALASCHARCHSFRMTGCPIRKSSDQRLFAPTKKFSEKNPLENGTIDGDSPVFEAK